MKTPEAGPTGQCLTLLREMCRLGWRAPAWALNQLGMLNERGRISDLRHLWGVPIEAEIENVGGGKRTTYVVPKGHRREARALIRSGERTEARRAARKEKAA